MYDHNYFHREVRDQLELEQLIEKMASLAAPVRVSPLIKFGRWAALLTGIIYGRSHFKTLSAKETVIREEETKQAVIRNAQLAEEKAKYNRIEMIELAGQAGVKVPPDF
ncbi:ATP synthase subunit e, mitochondrial [Panulirus ornatus]|uniref:ATP synthase subunit e, mitochondrial n=1 Tax=Panulirus ornatus TaxID=150431 RepID=UPI003A885C8E